MNGTKPRKILLVTSHFYPENFKANDMAFELAARGYDVTVLTPIPDYPQGKYYKGYGIFKRRSETKKGVKIIRTFVIPRRKGTAGWLTLNYISHTVFSSLRAIWLGISRKYDAVLIHETSPVMVAIPGIIVSMLQRIPAYFWVLDLWPESISAASNIHNRHIINLFGKITRWLYKHSHKILISSRGFRKSINRMGDFDSKIEFFPNWVDASFEHPEWIELPEFPAGFNVVFAGNIGDAQDMPHLLEAAKKLDGKGVNLILVGDGRKREWVSDFVKENNLKNVFLPGRFPLKAMPGIFAKADVLLLSLKDNPIFALTVPAKLQAYMSSGKPIVAMINGEGADVIKDADCGWSVPAENSDSLAELLLKISSESPDVLMAKGKNGLEYCNANYDFNKCINNLERIIKE